MKETVRWRRRRMLSEIREKEKIDCVMRRLRG